MIPMAEGKLGRLIRNLKELLADGRLDARARRLLSEAEARMEAARKPARPESREPMTGIWYYVYLHPEWKLETFRTDEYGEGVDHFGAWGTHIVPILRAHYQLDDRTTARLKETAYGMPRGRVDRISPEIYKVGERPGDWVFFHGDDFPSGLVRASQERKLISAFGLSRVAAVNPDKIRFEVSAHEKMIPEEREGIQKLLGIRIPY
jgi:hypothetical protein